MLNLTARPLRNRPASHGLGEQGHACASADQCPCNIASVPGMPSDATSVFAIGGGAGSMGECDIEGTFSKRGTKVRLTQRRLRP